MEEIFESYFFRRGSDIIVTFWLDIFQFELHLADLADAMRYILQLECPLLLLDLECECLVPLYLRFLTN